MTDAMMRGSGYYSYSFSTRDKVKGYCSTCDYTTDTYDVCCDDWGDYSIQCKLCNDYVDTWKDGEDE